MEGKVGIIVGQRGSGKTTTAKKIIAPVNPEALWIHGFRADQYRDIYSKPSMSTKDFTQLQLTMRDGVVLYEEATIYFPHQRNPDLVDLLVGSRERNVTVLLVFHSWRYIPHYVYDLTDFIIVHKTKDDEELLRKRFHNEEMLQVFRKVQQHENLYYSQLFKP